MQTIPLQMEISCDMACVVLRVHHDIKHITA